MAEINMTPFIDVMLVLLIVFMVAAPLLTAGVPLELPSARPEGRIVGEGVEAVPALIDALKNEAKVL